MGTALIGLIYGLIAAALMLFVVQYLGNIKSKERPAHSPTRPDKEPSPPSASPLPQPEAEEPGDLPTEVVLYNSEDQKEQHAGYRSVRASIGEEDGLIIHCTDINKTAKDMWGDSDVEFYLILQAESKNQLAQQLKVTENANLDLLHQLKAQFGGVDGCFEDLMKYFKQHGIEYRYDRW